MINVEFFGTSPITGFHICGHSGYGEQGDDIVCATVSSAAYMTVNTVTDILFLKPIELYDKDGEMYLKLDEHAAKECQSILQGFKLHILSLSKEFKKYIKVTISEV